MTRKAALDSIVFSISRIEGRLSGDDSPLANPWEEIKEQLQHGETAYWSFYLQTVQQCVSGFVAGLSADALAELSTSLKCVGVTGAERALTRRLLSRGRKKRFDTLRLNSGISAIEFLISPPTVASSIEPAGTIAMHGYLVLLHLAARKDA